VNYYHILIYLVKIGFECFDDESILLCSFFFFFGSLVQDRSYECAFFECVMNFSLFLDIRKQDFA
jgi:hypothetical protein